MRAWSNELGNMQNATLTSPVPNWLDSPLAPTEKKLLDYRKSFLKDSIPPLPICICSLPHIQCAVKCCECPLHAHTGRRPRHLYKNHSYSDIYSTEQSRTCERCGKCLFIYNTPGGTR